MRNFKSRKLSVALSLLLVLVLMVSVFAVSAHAADETVTEFTYAETSARFGDTQWVLSDDSIGNNRKFEKDYTNAETGKKYRRISATSALYAVKDNGGTTLTNSAYVNYKLNAVPNVINNYLVFDFEVATDSDSGFLDNKQTDIYFNSHNSFYFMDNADGSKKFTYTNLDGEEASFVMSDAKNSFAHITVVVEYNGTDTVGYVFCDGEYAATSLLKKGGQSSLQQVRVRVTSNGKNNIGDESFCYNILGFRSVSKDGALNTLVSGDTVGDIKNWADWDYIPETPYYTISIDGGRTLNCKNEASFEKLIASSGTVVVNLYKDIDVKTELSDNKNIITLKSNSDVTINLNGKTLTHSGTAGHFIYIGQNGKLTVNGGNGTDNVRGKIVRATKTNQLFLNRASGETDSRIFEVNNVDFEVGGNVLNNSGIATLNNCTFTFSTTEGKMSNRDGGLITLNNCAIINENAGSNSTMLSSGDTKSEEAAAKYVINGGSIYVAKGDVFRVQAYDTVEIKNGATISKGETASFIGKAYSKEDGSMISAESGVKFVGGVAQLVELGITLPKNNYIKKTAEGEYVVGTPDFVVYNNLTLYTDFDLNVYVPVAAVKNAPTVSGATYVGTYTDEKIGECHKYTLAGVTPYGAADTVEFTVTGFDKDDMAFTLTLSTNVIKYATNILNNADEADAYDLMKSIINYVYASYTMNGKSDTTVTTAYETYCAGYELTASEASVADEGTLANVFTGVQYNLDSAVKYRFNLKADYNGTVAVTYYKDGVRVTDSYEVVDGVVDGNAYIELAVRAYDLAKLVEISAGTDAGSYDLAAYLAFASVQGNQKLVAVVNALVDYAAKAAAYKA